MATGTSKSRWVWLLQCASGAGVIGLVGVHWVAQHYLEAGGLRSYQEVVAYLRQPAAFGLEAAFLIVVTAHALLGVRGVLTDLGLPARLRRPIDTALWTVGLLTVLYGLQLTWQTIGQ